jgi:hypothetical protein
VEIVETISTTEDAAARRFAAARSAEVIVG